MMTSDESTRRLDRLSRALRRRIDWVPEGELVALEAEHADALAAEGARERRKLRATRIEVLPLTTADALAIAAETHTRTRMVRAVEGWLATDVPVFVGSGLPGVGKTMSGAAALATLGGDYVRAPELARCYAAMFGEDVECREALVAQRGLVVVDDIGAELRADLLGVALLEMLDARRRGQRSIWITNLSRGDFEARYSDPRLLSRLAQSAKWCVDVGADLRRGR